MHSYTGLFTDFVPLNIDLLAKRSNTKKEIIANYLKELSKYKVIQYIPRKKTPYLIYTQERLPLNFIKLTKEVYQERKDNLSLKINSVINYAETKTTCRSKFLLEYFGQGNAPKCGFCDICKEAEEKGLTKAEYKEIYEEIISILGTEIVSVTRLIEKSTHSEERVLEVIRFLKDNEEIESLDGNKIRLLSL